MKQDSITLFSIGNAYLEAGGPRTRITSIAAAIRGADAGNQIILGKKTDKLKMAMKASKADVLYVETNTTYIKLIDLLTLTILFFKSKKRVFYIRDVYIELFPQKYKNLRGRKDVFFIRLTHLYYSLLATRMAFPTMEMGALYFRKNRLYFSRPYFSFPPGTVTPANISGTYDPAKNVKFLYLGSTQYANSGFEDFVQLIKVLHTTCEFHILSPDKDIEQKIYPVAPPEAGKHIRILSLKHDEVLRYIKEQEITFAIHSRPRNEYDDITFPIKFMDFISCCLPTITCAHKPIVDLVGGDYPFFVDRISIDDVSRCMDLCKADPQVYHDVVKRFEMLREEKTYTNQIKMLNEI